MAPLIAAAPFIAIAASVAGGAVAAYGAYSSSQAQSAMAKYNADVARSQAEAQRKMGEVEEQRIRERGAFLLGRQKAAYGASDVSMEGSPLLVMAETAHKVFRDANYAQLSANYMAGLSESHAAMADAQASWYNTSGTIMLGGSLLTTGLNTVGVAQKVGLIPMS